MDIGSISATLSSLKAAKDIGQTLLDLRNESEIRTKVIELQSQIMSAQSSALDAQAEQFELRKKLSEIEAELTRLQRWAAESARYSLIEISKGAFVYELTDQAQRNEPKHWLCANCFSKNEKSIFQFSQSLLAAKCDIYKCHRCNSEIKVANPSLTPEHPEGWFDRGGGGPQGWMGR